VLIHVTTLTAAFNAAVDLATRLRLIHESATVSSTCTCRDDNRRHRRYLRQGGYVFASVRPCVCPYTARV